MSPELHIKCIQGRIQVFWKEGSDYFIFMGYLKTGGGGGVRANPLNPFWIRHWHSEDFGLTGLIFRLIYFFDECTAL